MSKKLFWHNNDSHVSRELYDPVAGKIVGGILRNDNDDVWDVRKRDDSSGETVFRTFTSAPIMEEAKCEMEKYICGLPEYENTIVVDEPKITVVVYENALRSIVAIPEDAIKIARAVLANPAAWEPATNPARRRGSMT